MAVIASFFNEKGGTSKSTLVNNFAAGLASKRFGLKVLVIDTDAQKGLHILRNLEVEHSDEQEHKNIYDIVHCNFKKAKALLENDDVKKNYDVILVDFPGTIMAKDIGEVLILIPNFIVPCKPASTFEHLATKGFLERLMTIKEERSKKKLPTKITGIISYKDRNESLTELYDLFDSMNINRITTPVKKLKFYEKPSTLSSILESSDKKVKQNWRSVFGELMEELNLN